MDNSLQHPKNKQKPKKKENRGVTPTNLSFPTTYFLIFPYVPVDCESFCMGDHLFDISLLYKSLFRC